jgi:superoxide dismutase, Fe-Mn family
MKLAIAPRDRSPRKTVPVALTEKEEPMPQAAHRTETREQAAVEYKLPELPYAMNALEPHISRETLEYHYGKHHAGYVKKLNALVRGTAFEGRPLEKIIAQASPGPLFNNAAQVWNHTFYWHSLSPDGGGAPGSDLAQAMDRSFGSFDGFRERFTKEATSLFGSGWVWLVKGTDGRLVIQSAGNAGTPVSRGERALLTCDVWEHAYYIDYRNERARYIDAFWNLVNWRFASENFSG